MWIFYSLDLIYRKIEGIFDKQLVSNTTVSITFRMNTGPDFGGSYWICHKERCFRSTLEITLVYLFDAMELSLLSLELLQAENFHQTKVLISTYFDPICFEKYVTKRLVKWLKYESKMSDLNINGKVSWLVIFSHYILIVLSKIQVGYK